MLQSNADFRMQAQVPAAVPIEDKFGRLLSLIIFLKSIVLVFVHIADNVTNSGSDPDISVNGEGSANDIGNQFW